MKKLIFTLFVAFMATVALRAQQIAVVNTNGVTKLFRTFPDAINEADPGSVIYLPGGGFTISDDVKITKKLTIIGIGHYVKSENPNVDGNTSIAGNLWFNEGSSGSAVMGCYINGNVNIGADGAEVNDVLIRYCNLNSVQVKNNTCKETIVNQNYIRSEVRFSGANGVLSNNVIRNILDFNNGRIENNILCQAIYYSPSGYGTYVVQHCTNTQFLNNVFLSSAIAYVDNSSFAGNLCINNGSYAEYNLGSVEWNDVFQNYNGGAISPESNFHFADAYKQYETKCGIYAGTGFKGEMAPVPYITFKDVKPETDAQGKLNVRIRVSANK